jgi:hypothetical protein
MALQLPPLPLPLIAGTVMIAPLQRRRCCRYDDRNYHGAGQVGRGLVAARTMGEKNPGGLGRDSVIF